MQETNLSIRILSVEDLSDLQAIARDTFYESFIEITKLEDMHEYLDSSFSSENLLKELNDPNSIFYFIELDEQLIGYGKINFDKPPYGIEAMQHCMEIQRIYIKKEYHGIGAAQKLMQVFLEEAKIHGLTNIWLSTGSFNNRALGFYRKYGFEIIAHHAFPVGETVYDDVILMLEMDGE